jgi:uncharacterized protein (TIGR02453 family)
VTPAEPRFGGFPDTALEFYEGLEADNSRTYWATHRDDYEKYVRDPMRALLAELAPEFGEGQVFLPHRDIRFSRDKSPYKTHQGAFVNVEDGVGYYVQIAAGGLLVAAGWHPQGEQILRFREAVLGPDGAALGSVLATVSAAGYTVGGDRLTTRPRGQAPGHHREELTRFKSLEVSIDHGSPGWLGHAEAADRVAANWRELRPVVDWLQAHVGPGRSGGSRAPRSSLWSGSSGPVEAPPQAPLRRSCWASATACTACASRPCSSCAASAKRWPPT